MKHLPLIYVAMALALASQAQAASPCPPGFAMLQASDTCVRISGSVRADALAGSGRLQTHSGARLQMDVRKRTEYGPLRAVVAVGNIRR
jgi:hypothetical protein